MGDDKVGEAKAKWEGDTTANKLSLALTPFIPTLLPSK